MMLRRPKGKDSYWHQHVSKLDHRHFEQLHSMSEVAPPGKSKRTGNGRRVGLLLSALMLSATLAIAVEGGIRVARSIFRDGGAMTLLRSSPNAIVDDTMGWSSPRGETVKYTRKCYGDLVATYDPDGLRVLHPLGAKQPTELRVCVLGDSVTQAYQLTDETPYYHVL